ncbi:hypothetical protein GJ496_009661 [Pomphorhynchus laevis]|nr:hypothetical protein GJ496_009661 [Pomphorhynchus laevis]
MNAFATINDQAVVWCFIGRSRYERVDTIQYFAVVSRIKVLNLPKQERRITIAEYVIRASEYRKDLREA